MKKLFRFSAFFMILLILCSNLPIVHAKNESITIRVSGQENNPYFADTSFVGGSSAVNAHRDRVYKKLGVHSRTELIEFMDRLNISVDDTTI